MNTETTVNPVIAAGLRSLETARWLTGRMLEGIDAAGALTRPCKDGNHAMWVCGHNALSDDFFIAALAGADSALPESWNELFGMKSTVRDDPAAYPSFEEVRAAMDERRAALIEWCRGLSDDQVEQPTPEAVQQFAATYGAVPGSLAVHEALHAGQVSACRRALGIERLF